MAQKPIRLGYLLLNAHFAPELHFILPENIERFSWIDSSQTKWQYKLSYSTLENREFEVDDDIYD